MADIQAHTGAASYSTDCLTCREYPRTADDFDGDAHRRWARRHVENNPGHQVHVERGVIRSYRSTPGGTA
jgi:hypothetical protein